MSDLAAERAVHRDALRRGIVSEQPLQWQIELALDSAARLTPAEDVFLFPADADHEGELTQRACLHCKAAGTCVARGPWAKRALALARAAYLGQPPPPGDDGGTTFVPTVLVAGREKLGCIVAASDRAKPWDDGDRHFIGAIADCLAIALRMERQAVQEQRWRNSLALLDEVATECAEHPVDVALPIVLERLCRSGELDFACLTFLDTDRKELVFGWSHKDRSFLPDPRRRFAATGLPASILREKQPLRGTIDDFADGLARARARELGLNHFAGAPMVVRDRVIGILFAARKDRVIGDEGLRVLGAIGLQIAVACDNARLFAETEQRAADLELVHTVGAALARTLDIEVAMRETLAHLVEKFQLEGIRIYRVRGDFIESFMGAGPLGETMVESIRLSKSDPLFSKYLTVGRASENDVTQLGEPAKSRLMSRGIGRAGGVPLLIASDQANDRTPPDARTSIGVLAFIRKGSKPFSRSELDLLDVIGGQLAVALRNSTAREHIVRQERLTALGGLSALVAHEVRNPLGVIVHSLGLIGKLVRLEGDAKLAYTLIQEEAARLDGIVAEILDFSRPYEPRLHPSELDRLLREAVASARTGRPPEEKTRTLIELGPGLPPVPMDERLLHQALVNLLTNAYQALDGKGTVRVEASAISEKKSVRIIIADDGPGLSEEALRRMFEPFYTTKAKGGGLGLAIVKRIIEGHHGDILAEANPTGGARFVIELPAGG